jgi:hypothetical protein
MDLHLAHSPHPVVGAHDRHRQPGGLSIHNHLHAVRPRAASLGELRVVQRDEGVASPDLVEKAKPWEEIRLMDRD